MEKKNNNKANGIMILFTLLFLIFVVVIFNIFISYINMMDKKEICDRYNNEYNYHTEFEGNIWDGTDCYIFMEDGTKVNIEDFNIADYKKPIKR